MGNYFDDKSVFITGASGLIGSWLVKDLLNKKAQITCLVRDFVPNSMFFSEGLDKKVNIVRAELEDLYSIERVINEYQPEIVIHLGAQTIVGIANNSPIGTFNSNIKGTWNLLEACRLHDKTVKSIVIASSDKAYGEQKQLPYTEESPLLATNPYDVSKSCADMLAKSYALTYNLPITISRCGNFFGGGDLNFSRIVPGTIKSAYFEKNPTIRSNGKYVRDYIYVKDAVNAYLTLAEKTQTLSINGEAFNFSNEIQLTVLELTAKILHIMDKGNLKPIIKNEAKNEILNQHLSSKKAKKILGWESKWKIEDGLKETIGWYINYFKNR
ncbi:MAG: GDP-mannose 4,6-dehydratase [Candidatus Micrarchaeia archaeon]